MFVKNPQNNQGLKPLSREERLRPYVQVAEGMETQFSAHLIEQMRKTVPRENPPSTAENYYQSLMDNERAKIMAQSDTGIGLKKVILDQIVPANLKQQPNTQQAVGAYQTSKELTNEQ